MTITKSKSLKDRNFARLEQLGAGPKRSMGQNFLVNELIVQKIVDAAALERFDQTVEVGPGLGALTDRLIEKSSSLVLVEFDRLFAKYWREDRGCQVFEVDALKANWSEFLGTNSVLVSNLPYQISSRLLVDLSVGKKSPQRMVLMFQKEVAQRIQAEHGTSDYSLLSLIAQTFWSSRFLLEAGSIDFYPKPNVASRVLVFDRRMNMSGDQQLDFLKFAKLCFEQRKKKLIRRLTSRYDKDAVLRAFEDLKISDNTRVGQLGPQVLLTLFQTLSPLFP